MSQPVSLIDQAFSAFARVANEHSAVMWETLEECPDWFIRAFKAACDTIATADTRQPPKARGENLDAK